MSAPTNETIYALLKKLDEKVSDGFKGVHERQDEANHSTAKNTAFRYKTIGAYKLIGLIGVITGVIMAINEFV